MTPTLPHFLVLSALLLAAGITTLALRRNAIGMLMGIELMAAAAGLNLVAFDAFLPAAPDAPRIGGQMFALFIILLAAVQAALALALVVHLHRCAGSVEVDQVVAGTEP